jgi:hypothetical protein
MGIRVETKNVITAELSPLQAALIYELATLVTNDFGVVSLFDEIADELEDSVEISATVGSLDVWVNSELVDSPDEEYEDADEEDDE